MRIIYLHIDHQAPTIERDGISEKLRLLIEGARKIRPTPEEKEEQRRSFAFGNTRLANPNITRETIDRAAEKLKQRS